MPGHERRQELARRGVQPANECDVHADAESLHERDHNTDERDPSKVYGLDAEQQLAPGASGMGAVYAISVETGETLWRHEQRAGVMSMVATGGGLVFGGDVAGDVKAYDETTGEVLWQATVGSPISGYPVAYAVDGKQYLAVSTGLTGVTRNATRFTPEIVPAGSDTKVVVFALP